MYQVGVTGGIGSGKTMVCSVLEILGVPVYNADREAKCMLNTHPVLREGVIGLLGEEAYRDGKLDRAYVGSRVFGDREMLEKLNTLIHPAVREDFHNWASGYSGVPYVVKEAAILFESGANRLLDLTVLVYAPSDLRIRRVMDRDKVTREDVKKRMMHQMDDEEKRILADEIILNDGREMLIPQIVALHEKIVNRR
ncbi:MAG: dephospho-CoA kinase [Bacteroidota bacterium]